MITVHKACPSCSVNATISEVAAYLQTFVNLTMVNTPHFGQMICMIYSHYSS